MADSTKQNQIGVSMIITGDCDSLDFITTLSGLKPTSIYYKGDKFLGKRMGRYEVSTWSLDSGISREGNEIEAHFKALYALIESKIDYFSKLSTLYDFTFRISGYWYEGPNPGFFVDSKVLNEFKSINYSLDFDLYVLNGNTDSNL